MTASSAEFLCENCGYSLEGLNPGGECPECGRAIAASDPAHRVGTPWQRRPTPDAWAATFVCMLLRPRRTWDRARVEGARSLGLLAVNVSLAGLLTVGFGLKMTNGGWTMLALGGIAGALIFALLTAVEWAGIRFFGRRRGWRTTGPVALVVCAHASFGWVLIGPLYLPSALAALSTTWIWGRLDVGMTSALGGAFLIGLLIFETLVYVGFRRMRFANPPGDKADR